MLLLHRGKQLQALQQMRCETVNLVFIGIDMVFAVPDLTEETAVKIQNLWAIELQK